MSPDMADSSARLLQLLDEQIDAMQAVLSALEAERDALNHRDAQALHEATERKARSLATAKRVEVQRRRIAQGTAETGPPEGQNARIGDRWQRMLSLTRQCQELNDANGLMIRWQRHRVEETLCLMRGGYRESAPVYGPDGESRRPKSSRPPLASV